MGNKPVVPETASPATDRRPPRNKRGTVGSKGKAEISNPVQKPLTHRPYIDIGYQEDAEGENRSVCARAVLNLLYSSCEL